MRLMNENEADKLYQEIFCADRIERWESWQRDGNTKAGMRPSGDHPLAEISKTKWRWKGGITYYHGYRQVRIPKHPRASAGKGRYVFEHILMMEILLGEFVPLGKIVHHKNEIRDDNVPNNLQLLSDPRHHVEVHRIARAVAGCGNPDWRKCTICGAYDNPENLTAWHRSWSETNRAMSIYRHAACHAAVEKARYHSHKEALKSQLLQA